MRPARPDPAGKASVPPGSEPVMVLRARDRHFLEVLAHHCLLLAKDPLSDPRTVLACAERVRLARRWREEHG